jgi:hypothetical protein
MQKTTTLLFFMLTTLLLSAQGESKLQHSARFGFSGAFFGAGDVTGPCFYGEYVYPLTKYVALSPRVMNAYSSKINDYNYYDQSSSLIGSLSLKFTPFPTKMKRLKIDLGGSYHRFIKSYGEVEQSNDAKRFIIKEGEYRTNNAFGFIGSINLNLFENEKIEAGIRADMITGFQGTSLECESIQAGFYIGFRR